MTESPRLTTGRIALALLLVGSVLAAAAVGAAGTTTYASLDGKGNDVLTYEFPINNVTFVQASYGSVSAASPLGQDMDPYSLEQDMDPYSLGQDMDPY